MNWKMITQNWIFLFIAVSAIHANSPYAPLKVGTTEAGANSGNIGHYSLAIV